MIMIIKIDIYPRSLRLFRHRLKRSSRETLPGKLSLETLLAWILVEFGSHDAAMLVAFLEIFAYFWMFFEVRSHFGSVL